MTNLELRDKLKILKAVAQLLLLKQFFRVSDVSETILPETIVKI